MDQTIQIGPLTRIQASSQGVFSELDDQGVIMHLLDGVYYGLNAVGVSIWKGIQEPIPFAKLIDRLLEEYEVERGVCEEDARALLLQLHEKGLVDIDA